MQKRTLGSSKLEVSGIGLGCMVIQAKKAKRKEKGVLPEWH
jgi:aryl-alcohol dehydrogenase-like predicted oxidoreductase